MSRVGGIVDMRRRIHVMRRIIHVICVSRWAASWIYLDIVYK
jgi:hypothetical protein